MSSAGLMMELTWVIETLIITFNQLALIILKMSLGEMRLEAIHKQLLIPLRKL
jgi:hypothetical protein